MKKHLGVPIVGLLSTGLFGQTIGECAFDVSPKAEKLFQSGLDDFQRKRFTSATESFLKAIEKEEGYPDARFLLGEISFEKRKYTAARKHYEEVIALCDDYNGEIYRKLGIIAYLDRAYRDAATYFEKAVSLGIDDPGNEDDARMLAAECNDLASILENPVPFDPKPVPVVCTSFDEYLANFSPDECFLLYTRRYEKKEKTMLTSIYVEEFTVSNKESGRFQPGEPMPYPFNQNNNEGGPTISADNKSIYFTICAQNDQGKTNCDIYYAAVEDGFWSEIKNAGEMINDPEAWDSQPSISANGDELYFVSSREGGFGGLDIYKSVKQEDGSWGPAQNLGRVINTDGNEKSPFLHSDSRTLYFSSDGHLGFGGYDIFYTKSDGENWQRPKNIGYPINSEEDDLGLGVVLSGEYAFFSSNSHKGVGGWDIFTFPLYQGAKPEEVVLIKGTLTEENGDPVPVARIEVKNLETKEIETISLDSQDGSYTAVVRKKEGQDLLLTVEKEGYAFASQYIDEVEDGRVEADVEVDEIKAGEDYRLNDILYASNTYDLAQRDKEILTAFAEFLMKNESIRVRVEGHTDNVGSSSDNLDLSKKRARAVYDYLVSTGVPSSRLSHQGYGANKPISSNSSEEGRAMNRRTVFVIVNK